MSVTMTSNADEISANLEGKILQISGAMTAKVDVLTIALQSHIIADKLQGQVLQQRGDSGPSLADSIRVTNALQKGNDITSSVFVEGSAEKYAAFQEFGTSHAYSIQPKIKNVLHFLAGGKDVFVKKIFHPPLRERSFLHSGLDDRKDDFPSGIDDAVQQVLEAE